MVVTLGVQIAGGTVSCTNCQLEDCILQCFQNAFCAAIDFMFSADQCIIHTIATACNTPVPAAANIHMRRASCKLEYPFAVIFT